MAFARPTLADLVTRIENDLKLRLPLTGGVLSRSVVAVLARVLAAAVYLLHGHLAFLSTQMFPDQSEAEYLERQAATFLFSRIPATYAAGAVTVTGTIGTIIPAASVLQRADGVAYAVDADTVIGGGGTVAAAVTCLVPGATGNAAVGVALAFVSPIAGVTTTTTVTAAGLGAGADAESDDALRARFIQHLQAPPQGGSASDYVQWARANAGVSRAWCYPEELGPGTVTVRFVRDGDGTGAAIIPNGAAVTLVQAYVDARRPVTANVTVVAPVASPLNVTVQVVPNTAATQAAVIAELQDLITRASAPGGTTLLSQIRTAIGLAAGVTDFTLSSPSADVTHAAGQLAILGTVSFV